MLERVLFVCTGNTCRSPMAEAVLKHLKRDIEVKSAGIFAGNGQGANPNAIQVLKKRGIDFTTHESQPVTDELMEWADVILTMTAHHKLTLEMEYPESVQKIFTLKEYTLTEEDTDLNPDILDPIGLSEETYEQTLNEIEKYIKRLIDQEEDDT